MLPTLERPETVTGVLRSVFVPSPSCPSELRPQHWTVASASKAQLWLRPTEIAFAVETPETETGLVRVKLVPSPIWPHKF